MLHSRKFQLHFYVCYTMVCTDEIDGRTLAIRSAVTCKQVVRTNLIYNLVKLLKEHRSTGIIGSLLGFVLLFLSIS